MAQTGSAQREPSMEEILASIRRIIEDSDTTRGANDSAPQVTEAALQRPDEVVAFREEFQEPAAETVSTAFVDVVPPVEAELPDEGTTDDEEFDASLMLDAALLDARSVDAPADEPEIAPQAASGEVDHVASETSQSVAAVRASIISEAPGRQVAAAFGELSDAFAASRRRSFDEIAEEMMRPMLQEWLDNNLPTLVERLVREEIERVARGAAR